jgi:hypothetical protein
MAAYLDKLRAERAQRLARMQIPRECAAGPRFSMPASEPEWVCSLWKEEVDSLRSRLKALERHVAALTDPPPAVAPEAQIRISDILDVVSSRFGLRVADLQGPSRRALVTDARQIAMYLARRLTRKSFISIGRQFGGRCHAGVFKAWRKSTGFEGWIPNSMPCCRPSPPTARGHQIRRDQPVVGMERSRVKGARSRHPGTD